jgi:hypothetical protein
MGSELRQRSLLILRVVAVLTGVAILLVLAPRVGGHKDAVAKKAVPSSSAAPAASKATASATAPAVQVAAGQTLCQAVPSLVSFSAQSLKPPGRNGGVNVSNADIVTKPAQVQALARQFCALPALSADPKACFASLGNWLQFIFSAADGRYWTVWIYSGGCMDVVGAGGQTRTAMPDSRLWPTVLADLRGARPLTS